MSAFIVSKRHIDAIVTTANAWDERPADPDELGRMLWIENVCSVDHRYNEHSIDAMADALTYSWPAFAPVLSPVEALKAIACYEYQSCEHPGWEASKAHAFVRDFRLEAISRLPGYREAAWEIAS